MGIEELLADKREEGLAIFSSYPQGVAKHGAYNIRIFESVARGETRDDSDVDFWASTVPNRSPWFLVGLKLDLEDFLGREVDVVTRKTLHEMICDRVLKEAISL